MMILIFLLFFLQNLQAFQFSQPWLEGQVAKNGCLSHLTLSKYQRSRDDDRSVKLLKRYPLCKALQIQIDGKPFVHEVHIKEQTHGFLVSYESPHLLIKKSITFQEDPYHGTLQFEFINPQEKPFEGLFGFELGAFSDQKKASFWAQKTPDLAEAFVKKPEKKIQRQLLTFEKKPSQKTFWTQSPVKWAGIGSQFFSFSFQPHEPQLWSSRLNRLPFNIQKNKNAPPDQTLYEHWLERDLHLEPQSSTQFELDFYWGPKKYDLLKKKNLTSLIDFGFFEVIAQPLFYLLKMLHKLLKNWGWSIIVMTLIFKLLLIPLQIKTHRSQEKLKKFQPHLNSLKEQFKDDKIKLQQETMTFMKEKGINPLSGCLPILPQIPLFFGLNSVFRQTFELRQSPFLLWLQDLSAPDPFFVLPVLYTLVMYAHQRLVPMPVSDPNQEKIMKFLPLVFSVFLLSLPSGLTLYFLVQSLAALAERFFIKKFHT